MSVANECLIMTHSGPCMVHSGREAVSSMMMNGSEKVNDEWQALNILCLSLALETTDLYF